MKLATISLKGKAEFVCSENGKEYFLWSDYADKFKTDKVVQSVKSFNDFIPCSDVLLPHLNKHQTEWKALSTINVRQEDYLLPFKPTAFRDFYCFEEHVMAARKGRGLDMIPEWYEAPHFYYSNHLSFLGPNDIVPYPKDSKAVDFELEISCIIGKEIRNATPETAKAAILGYSLCNDWTARDFQKFEMKVNMGPTKGKDFATTFGSYIITADELNSFKKNKGFDINFELTVNGERLTHNNWSKIHFSFEDMVVRASKNCTLYPGEVLASGTMGGGCLLEHNLGKDAKRWLKEGDLVEIKWLDEGPRLVSKLGPSQ